jgi:hypothetical protein
MAAVGVWTVSVVLDQDQPDVGTASATWTQGVDPAIKTFTYSSRVKVSVAEGNAFVAAAIAARDKWQGKATDSDAKSAWVLGALVTADPQAK